MAQRLATQYVKTCLCFTENQREQFINLFVDQNIAFEVKILENGNEEIAFYSDQGEQILLTCEKESGKYFITGSCCFSSLKKANIMRKAITLFKGSAEVHRIYVDRKVIYHYNDGAITKIVELKNTNSTVIYQVKAEVVELESLFQRKHAEEEIEAIQQEINLLLDFRHVSEDSEICQQIDQKLQKLTYRLFVLEV